MRHFLFLLGSLVSASCFAQEFHVTWRHLRQDQFVGRVRETGWGMGPTVYDYNTPFTVEVHLRPVFFYDAGRHQQPSLRDLSTGQTYHSSHTAEHNCRRLAVSGQRTTRDGQRRALNEKLSFSTSDIHGAIRSIRVPEWYRRIGDFPARGVQGEIGYILKMFILTDESVLPTGFRRGDWVAMGTARRILAHHLVTLPVGTVPSSAEGFVLNLQRGYDLIRAAGAQVSQWEQGLRIEQESRTYGYLIEVTAPPAR